jgi:hypothetical protein
VLYIGRDCETLPAHPAARTRATAWLIAALNSVEPYLMQLATIDIFAAGEELRITDGGAARTIPEPRHPQGTMLGASRIPGGTRRADRRFRRAQIGISLTPATAKETDIQPLPPIVCALYGKPPAIDCTRRRRQPRERE